MSIQDPIADMFTIIRNGQKIKKDIIYIPYSNIKLSIIKLLKKEGYIKDYLIKNSIKPILKVILKYFNNKPVIENIQRISKPGLRIYKKHFLLSKFPKRMGIVIISTSKGLMTNYLAIKYKLGGEIIGYIE